MNGLKFGCLVTRYANRIVPEHAQEVIGMEKTKILIVDDERRFCDSLSHLFQSKNYDVLTADCGKEAVALLNGTSFDLAILDLHLTDMLGIELVGEIKTKHSETEIVIVTGEADIDSAVAALKCGAYDYLIKPFEFEDLQRTVCRAIEKKRLTQEKERLNNQLILSEKKYRYLVNNSPDIIFTLDSKGNFSFVSEAVEQLIGFTSESLIGKHYRTIVFDEDQNQAKQYLEERKSHLRNCPGIELRLNVNDHSRQDSNSSQTLTVELKSMGIYEEIGNTYIGAQGVIRDINERCKLQAQLQRAERMEALGTLAGGIAHDFNNLLMGIQGRSTLISMDLANPHAMMEHIRAIDDYVHSAVELTRQLLGFSRGGEYEVKATDIIELIQKSSHMFGRTKKEISIETKFHKDQVVVKADAGQIEQVLLNLYVNSWQAMPGGGIIKLETDEIFIDKKMSTSYQLKPGNYVKISVTDTGIGMSQRTIQRIFDPFFTTKEKKRGTGLGLSSAYGIIKNHGGSINVRSKIGSGTAFFIYLPLSSHRIVKKFRPEQKIENGSETILLVDDEEMIIDVGKSVLTNLGYRVIAVNNGYEAINIIRHNGYGIDLVLLDMIMPAMGGGKVFDQIRKLRPDLPVILSSGYSMNCQAEKIMNKGCNGFIQKPFTLSEISQKVRQILDAQNSNVA
jgi:two-component system cell cycle sensor histidine kinase/response regulator CckA